MLVQLKENIRVEIIDEMSLLGYDLTPVAVKRNKDLVLEAIGFMMENNLSEYTLKKKNVIIRVQMDIDLRKRAS